MVRERGRRRRCVVLTDSNGRGVMPDTIGDFLGGEEREKWEIQVVQAFTLREALERLRRRDIGVEGARVVVDCITNDVRGTRLQERVEPGEVVERLRRVIGEMGGADEVVVCEVKPMQHINVVPFNARIHGLLLDMGRVRGCRMQVRHEHLGRDGYHIAPQYGRVLSVQYGCAIAGWQVPCPYWDGVDYGRILAEWAEREWPPLGGRGESGRQRGQGWRAPSRPYGGEW